MIKTKAMESEEEFSMLLDKMKQIHDAKSADYANSEDRFSNFRTCEMMGLPAWKGIIVRLGDKFSRISEFAKKETLEVKDESFEDTCIDMANYSLLLLQAYRDYKDRHADGDLPNRCAEPCDSAQTDSNPIRQAESVAKKDVEWRV